MHQSFATRRHSLISTVAGRSAHCIVYAHTHTHIYTTKSKLIYATIRRQHGQPPTLSTLWGHVRDKYRFYCTVCVYTVRNCVNKLRLIYAHMQPQPQPISQSAIGPFQFDSHTHCVAQSHRCSRHRIVCSRCCPSARTRIMYSNACARAFCDVDTPQPHPAAHNDDGVRIGCRYVAC